MNRYPLWKYFVMAIALAAGLLYVLPNFFGEEPAVQISSGSPEVKLDLTLLNKIKALLATSRITTNNITFENLNNKEIIQIFLKDTDTQFLVKDILQKSLNRNQNNLEYVVTLHLQSTSPRWLTMLHALPIYLGLDLRGGIYFVLNVDIDSLLKKKIDLEVSDTLKILSNMGIRYSDINRINQSIIINFNNQRIADIAKKAIASSIIELQWITRQVGQKVQIVGTFRSTSKRAIEKSALKQNITTLYNRMNQIGITESLIQQQGYNHIVIEIPGVQDVTKAKEIIGRTATLEARLVDPSPINSHSTNLTYLFPPDDEMFIQGNQIPVILQKKAIFTGDQIVDAEANFDEHHRPSVNIKLNSAGGRTMREISHNNIGKPMAIVLFEKGRGEVLTIATIQSELNDRFQITGQLTTQAAKDLAILLRSGSLAATMDIIEERMIGPSLGVDNIKKGFHSLIFGFCAIAVFMIVYYVIFGIVSVIGLIVNLLFLVAILSFLQVTLTLPGIAAIAFALGMAIDANVLINERIREELRSGKPPSLAIQAGYSHAWKTILDSNVTTMIVGLALLTFGSGTVRGFAVVHCIGTLTSMFSSVFFSRGLVNIWYGGCKILKTISIGQVYKTLSYFDRVRRND
ncbi:MAG: protein translocase subunit SecD [Burkholderia sp.]|nr:protein translocase subunit SecD [Burkholderia sp.]